MQVYHRPGCNVLFPRLSITGNKFSACKQCGTGPFASSTETPELKNGYGKRFSFPANQDQPHNPFQQPNTLFTPGTVSMPSSTASPFGTFQTSDDKNASLPHSNFASGASSTIVCGGSGTNSLASIFQPNSGSLVQGNSSNGLGTSSFRDPSANTTFQFPTPTGYSFPSFPSTSTSANSSLFSNQNSFSTTGVPSTFIFSSSTPSSSSCIPGLASGGLTTSGIQNSAGSQGRTIDWGPGATTRNNGKGSNKVPYSPTPEADGVANGCTCGFKLKMMSISAMPAYANKSHEELRMEYYESSNASGWKTPLDFQASFDWSNTPSNMFSFQPRSNFSPARPLPNPFIPNRSSNYSRAFDIPTTSTIPKAPEFAKSVTSFPPTQNPFSGFNPFSQSSSTAFTSPFTKSSSEGTFTFTPTSFVRTTQSAFQPQNILPSSMPASTMMINPSVSQSLTPDDKQLPQLSTAFVPSSWSTMTPSRPPFTSSPFIPFTSETISSHQTSYPNASQPGQFAQNTSSLSTSNLNQPSQAPSILPKITEINSQNTNGELSSSTLAEQPSPIMDPFGPRNEVNISVYQSDSRTDKPSGISSIAVSYNPSPLKKTPLLVRVRNLSLRQNRLSAQKLQESAFPERKEDHPHSVAPLMPRMNPRSWILNPVSGKGNEDCEDKVHVTSSLQPCGKSTSATDELATPEKDCHATTSLCQAEHLKVEEHENTLPLLPKLGREDYYTEPSINLLMEKEKSQPGFCSCVHDFVVGRRNYGSIKFLGQTDIRDLDLESIIQFNNREVIVYADTRLKPPEGRALNKPAEITLLNVKCIDKKTGAQYTDGKHVDKYEKKLIRRTEEEGAEFISFDPVQGEWKFRVQHF